MPHPFQGWGTEFIMASAFESIVGVQISPPPSERVGHPHPPYYDYAVFSVMIPVWAKPWIKPELDRVKRCVPGKSS